MDDFFSIILPGIISFIVIAFIVISIIKYIKNENKDIEKYTEKQNEKECYKHRVNKSLLNKYNELSKKMNKPEFIPYCVHISESKWTEIWKTDAFYFLVVEFITLTYDLTDEEMTQSEIDYTKYITSEKIPLDQIYYFNKVGESTISSHTSTSGGGSSLKGAVVGGLVAGAAGAVIGSRKPISTSTRTYSSNNYRTMLYYYKNPEDTVLSTIDFNWDVFDALVRIIPDKEYSVVISKSQSEQISEKPVDAKSKLQQLKEMYEQGLITEDEYRMKREGILRQI